MPLSGKEVRQLHEARRAGLGGGFTVPLHMAGERTASCSFASLKVGTACACVHAMVAPTTPMAQNTLVSTSITKCSV
jgi:hypothetical protein